MSKNGKDSGPKLPEDSRRKRAMRGEYNVDDDIAAAAEAKRALQFIENHLAERISVTRVAAACNTSPFHFSRRFAARQGESVMSYVRGRRLDKAAQRLLRERTNSLVDVAFDSGFQSQAAFTRAFTRSFGVSPSQYRKSVPTTTRTRRISKMQQPTLQQSIERIASFQVAGLSGSFEPSNYVTVADLWKRAVAQFGFPGRLGGETIGIFRNRDHAAQSFEHLAGVRIAPDAQTPSGFDVWTLPEQDYLVFKQMLSTGDLHPQVAAAQYQIWNERLPASGRAWSRTADFQIYPAGFKVGPGGWLAYYIPIE